MHTRLIKKYPNRRLYDTGASCYISNEDVRILITGGEDISIVDSKTGTDITRSVLLTILGEEELAGRTPIFTQKMLAEMIGFSDEYLAGILGIYLERCLEFFSAHQAIFRKNILDFESDDPLTTINKLIASQEKVLRQGQADNVG